MADLIDAASETAAASALKSLKGEFSQRIHALVDQLIHLRMLTEATLDFPEEEDVDYLAAADAQGQLRGIQATLDGVLASARQGALLREGMHVVLVGQPNVGKSSLMNALAGDDIAIVTDIAGTTRDTVREQILIDGIPLHLIDTAGLRDTDDVVEQHGIARTWAAVERADLALVLLDDRAGLTDADAEILARLPARLPRLVVRNKIDLSGQATGEGEHDGERVLRLSARSGDGVDALRRALLAQIGWQGAGDGVFLARERHLDALRRARAFLDAAELDYAHSELFADHLRMAQLALSDITGEFSADDLLGEIFGRFCIGK